MLTRAAALLSLLLAISPLAQARDVRIGVLEIFHPREMTLNAAPGEVLIVRAGSETFTLEPTSGTPGARFHTSANGIVVEIDGRTLETSDVRAASRMGGPVSFVLAIPGKISRTYRGTLLVKGVDSLLVPVVEMELETAVATAIQAESARIFRSRRSKRRRLLPARTTRQDAGATMISISATSRIVSSCKGRPVHGAAPSLQRARRADWSLPIMMLRWPRCSRAVAADTRALPRN